MMTLFANMTGRDITMMMTMSGPLLAMLAALLMAFPMLRPVKMQLLMLAGCLYMMKGLLVLVFGQSEIFRYYLLIFSSTYMNTVLGLGLSLVYLVKVVRLKLPWPTALPAVVMFLAGVANAILHWAVQTGEFARIVLGPT